LHCASKFGSKFDRLEREHKACRRMAFRVEQQSAESHGSPSMGSSTKSRSLAGAGKHNDRFSVAGFLGVRRTPETNSITNANYRLEDNFQRGFRL